MMVKGLGKLKAANAVDILLQELRADRGISYKDEVVYALGEIASQKALPYLNAYSLELKKIMAESKDPWLKGSLEDSLLLINEAIQKIKQKNF